METKHIREFLVLAELGSSYAAAEKLFCSQSSLVRHIQSMEEEFGVQFFDRTRRGFTLNANGRTFLPYAEKIALLQAQCQKMITKEQDEPNTVRFSAEGKVIDLILAFHKEYPEYILDYHDRQNIERQLIAGDIEVAFMCSVTASPDEIADYPFFNEEVLVLMNTDHPLASRESISFEELADEKFVTVCDEIVNDDMFLEMFRRVGLTQNIVATVPIPNDVKRLVIEGIGITLIHGNSATASANPKLKAIPLDPPMTYEVRLCYKKNVPLSKPAQDFVNFAKKWRILNPQVDLSLLA